MKLEEVILGQKDQKQELFLAVEQGLGSRSNNIQVMINPKMKSKAK